MSDWDTNSPADSGIISQYPGNERSARSAARSNFGVDHHETDDADVGKHETVRMLDQGGDPTAASGEGRAYAKVVDGIVELFYQDNDGNIAQLTEEGVLDVEGSLGYTPADIAGDTFTGDVSIGKDTPQYEWEDTSASADETIWQALASGTNFILRLANDARSLFTQILNITRSGTSVESINFPNGTLQTQGNPVWHDGRFFESDAIANFGTNMVVSFTHGLGSQPIIIQVMARAVGSNRGYADGEELIVTDFDRWQTGGGTNQRAGVVGSATDTEVHVAISNQVFVMDKSSTGSQFNDFRIDNNSNWELFVRAFA